MNRRNKNNYFMYIVVFCISTCVTYAAGSTGTINASFHTALVCHEATCTVAPGYVNFLPTGVTPITISDSGGITGTAWGNEMGWINMNPTGSGVTFSDTTTGSTTGYAWSQVSGWINFAPTGYGVKINSNGEFQGYAWSGGENGGWIKFECGGATSSSCVKTDWLPVPARTTTSPGGGGGGGGGGGYVIPPVSTSSTTPSNNNVYVDQKGKQNQKTDYANDFRADIDDDGIVELFDFNKFILRWGQTKTVDAVLPKKDRCTVALDADINCDGRVDVLDFNLLMINWGKYVGIEGAALKAKNLIR